MQAEYTFIKNNIELTECINYCKKEKIIAVDLEADSMFHYKEKVCLIQLATVAKNFIIDPLAINNTGSLSLIFSDKNIIKVFHGADYDIRSLYKFYKITVNNLFDTELASRFIGKTKTGLSSVVQERFNVVLDKRFQKKDWSKRPLLKEMLDYAVSDVIYLIQLYYIIKKELVEKNRYLWVTEECKKLSMVKYTGGNNKPLVFNFKGAMKLKPKNLTLLEALLVFRKTVAQKKDKPLFKIINNEALLKLAQEIPLDIKKIKELKILSTRQLNMYGNSLVQIILSSHNREGMSLLKYSGKKKITVKPCVSKRVKKLKLWRDNLAEKLKLDPPLLFNKATLLSIAEEKEISMDKLYSMEKLSTWQKKEFGYDIVEVIEKV